MYLTGDLRKYAWNYYTITESGWFSEEVIDNGRNFGFAWLTKLLSQITDGDFQILLIVIAVVTEIAVAVIIYRYSPAPWLSYLLWDCFGFYIFGFSAIKQALAMGLLMFAFTGIMEERPRRFFLLDGAGRVYSHTCTDFFAGVLDGEKPIKHPKTDCLRGLRRIGISFP